MMMKPQSAQNRPHASLMNRVRDWLRKPIEQKVFGLGGRWTTLGYARWVRTYRYDFDGILHPHELLSAPSPSLAHSTHYLVSDVYSLKLLLDEIRLKGKIGTLFLDIGCGKGMPALYARHFYGFKECIGMDFSEKLIHDAQRNLTKSRDPNVRFIQADAADFSIPDQPGVIYLHNPFGPELLSVFLKNNLEHFRRHKSLLAYAFDIHRHIFPPLGFEVVYRSQKFSHSIWQMKESESS